MSSRTEQTSNGTIRITSARSDLADNPDRLLAGDGGTLAGHARCTQNIRLSPDAAPSRIPSMMLCWRISAARSVVTLAVARMGKPSAAAASAVIDHEWSKLD